MRARMSTREKRRADLEDTMTGSVLVRRMRIEPRLGDCELSPGPMHGGSLNLRPAQRPTERRLSR